jgi:hypothetical protein
MSKNSLKTCLVASLFVLFGAVTGQAQHVQPFGPTDINPDFQLFAPAELGDFGERPAPAEGYFIVYERLAWAMNGIRKSTGADLPIYRSIDHFPGGPFVPPVIDDGLKEDVPDTHVFSWGNRYDLGYICDHHGWLVSIIEGLQQNQTAVYGFVDGENLDFPNSTVLNTNPLGSIGVVFTAGGGLMDGFIDVINNTVGNPQQGGVDHDNNVGDGFADDVDGDGVHGPDGLDTTGDGVPDTIGVPTDFDDLVTFLPTFQTVTSFSVMKITGVELMKMYRFDPFHQGSVFELYYGARYLRVRDDFDVSGSGGTLGLSNWNTRVMNHIVGPQLGGRFLNRRGRWTLGIEGRFLAGYNIRNLNQDGRIAGGSVAGAHNSPLFLNPTTFTHGIQDNEFSPVGELRVETNFQLTHSVALKVGWTGTYVGNIARAASSVVYNLPDMGLLANDNQEMFTNGINFGVVINR